MVQVSEMVGILVPTIVVFLVIVYALMTLWLKPDVAAFAGEGVEAEVVSVVVDVSPEARSPGTNGNNLASPYSESDDVSTEALGTQALSFSSEPEPAADISTEAEDQSRPYDDPPLPSGHEYEVFLSFRGPDTRKAFADCLYHTLVNARVNTFRGKEELRTGEQIGENLLEAIKQSKISIPIFSKNYASSKWCLKELRCMLECKKKGKHIILPVFYDVTPTEVQDHTDYYGSALQKHKKKDGTNSDTEAVESSSM